MAFDQSIAPRTVMEGALLSTLAGPGALLGMDTVRACMKDEALRMFIGHALLHEIMPSMGLTRETLDPLAMAVCAELESPAIVQPVALLLQNAVRGWETQALPLIRAYIEREEQTPPCLCMGLSCLVMLFAGVRREEDGRYAYLRGEERCFVAEDEDVLFSFSRLSCDMPPESLSYAVLSDRAIWESDLRDVPGLEDTLTNQLRDLQLLGLEAALEKAWKSQET